ncbi:MAG TPA: L,D-transpeptidase family protein, partial [Alphaproteobacteria bacterium]|nr:L,D-transpeptidase family protein [Alphaproteobacteria bacterium]
MSAGVQAQLPVAGLSLVPGIEDPASRLEGKINELRRLELSGGFVHVPDAETLRPGDRSPAVPRLAARLRQSGDLPADALVPLDPEFFDQALARAVESFQRRHGLDADGVVGRRTFAALNEPVADLIARATINLARLLDQPTPGPGAHIIVNVPDYRLVAYRDGVPVLEMPVIVGRSGRATPIFSSPITHMVVNPTWTVPPGILRYDIARRMLDDPDYMMRMGMTLIDSDQDEGGAGLDPGLVDWDAVRNGYRGIGVRQPAGPDNPLGRFRFHMDNDKAIYLHDTNEPELFSEARRAISSGCVRVADPFALAAFVADGADGRWQRWATDTAWQTRWIKLARPIPVDLIYRTVWVDETGVLQVREDIYGRDRMPAPRIAGAIASAG